MYLTFKGQIIPISPEVCYSFGLARLAKLLWYTTLTEILLVCFEKVFFLKYLWDICLLFVLQKNNFSVIHV